MRQAQTVKVRPGGLALVTGASSGIGRELALQFARHGHPLVLVGRTLEPLLALKDELERTSISCTIIQADLTDDQSSIAIMDEISRGNRGIEFLVNNAGFGAYGNFIELDAKMQLEIIAVNVSALTSLTRLLLPGMLKRGYGRILNVASTAAFSPGPRMAVYYATKAYVLSFSHALAEELAGTGITVSALCPGPTNTRFQQRAGMQPSANLLRFNLMSADRVASVGYSGMMDGQRTIIPGMLNKILALGSRLVPRAVSVAVVKFFHRNR